MQTKIKTKKAVQTRTEGITYTFDASTKDLVLEANQTYIIKYNINDKIITEEVQITDEIQ